MLVCECVWVVASVVCGLHSAVAAGCSDASLTAVVADDCIICYNTD